MSTFVVRFAGLGPGAFRGRVEHVRSGEKSGFSSAQELLGFFERMNAADRHLPHPADLLEEPVAAGTKPAARRSRRPAREEPGRPR
ncbi:MAG: hypothetical protein HZC42_05370 [Candidatus Eisenbacteria bacterium]|nr:hypothetical protein [Candidatus Eisenbacteria bacterium]